MNPWWIVLIAALVSWLACGTFLGVARQRGWGKAVRRDGPGGHLGKEGTPTMGGLAFLIAGIGTAIAVTIWAPLELPPRLPFAATLAPSDTLGAGLWALLALILASAALGWWDDLVSLRRKRATRQGEDASTGILARWRLAGQATVALGFAFFAVAAGREAFGVPALDLLVFAFVITGAVNAFNMTDGLDGLAAGVALIVLLAFWGDPLAASLTGALLGFLWFNAHPARIFMGGAGAEALGAAVAGLAILHGDVWRLPIVALVPMAEVLSVMVQVSWFRYTGGRRLLRMSPLHHHFELSGWPETRVVTRFWIVTALTVTIGISSRGWW
ncbi:MAG: phospho-N-acetylmuramoyl-pentapeptide-transferase [Trueperaceae bacterium]